MSQTTAPVQSIGESVESRAMPSLPWYHFALTLGLMGLAIFACRDAWLDIIHIVKKDDEASHILLVPIVFAWLVWSRRKSLAGWKPSPTFWGGVIVLGGAALWLFGYIKAMQVFWHLGAIIAMFGAFTSMNGLDIVRRLWPAFVLLLFLLPVPGIIRHPLALALQNASAQATEVVMIMLGYELIRHGNLLVVNGYQIGIAEACNGMRMISMLLLIVYAFVFSHNVQTWVRVVLIAAAVPIAIACNILRLVPTVVAYGYGSESLADQIHDWLGWGLAFASYFGLMGLLWLMRWLLLPVDRTDKLGPAQIRAQRKRMQKRQHQPNQPTLPLSRRLAGPVLGVVAVLIATVAVGQSLPDGGDADGYHARIRAVAQELPREVGPWTAVDTEVPEGARALLRPNVLISRRYIDESTNRSFELMLVQCQDARDMEGHYPPNCYPTSGWESQGRQLIELQVGNLQGEAIEYGFERMSPNGMIRIDVVNLIVVPDKGFATTMGQIRRLAGTVQDRYYGAAQVHFVFNRSWDREERLEVVDHVGASLEPLLRAVLDKSGAE